MRLTESQARRVARAITDDVVYAGAPLVHELGRQLTEDEAAEIVRVHQRGLEEMLGEFEFLDPVEVPQIDPVQTWCEEHLGHGFRRPKGSVVYVVTGETAIFEHGLIRRHVPQVKRSSDGQTIPMTKLELLKMVDLNAEGPRDHRGAA